MIRLLAEAPAEVVCWGVKTVRSDFTTRDGFEWPPGGWVRSCNHVDPDNAGPCPSVPGDGLSVGLDFAGMAQGGVPALTVLIVGWVPADELGRDHHKVRVSRAFVAGLVDGARAVREWGRNADLSGADLSGADLSGAYLSGAYLAGAYLYGADVAGAGLSGA